MAIDFSYKGHMHRAYTSNISPIWRFDRQEALLRAALPGYPKGVEVFRDEMDGRVRRGRKPASLYHRAEMLRATTKRRGEIVHVATLAVMAWTQDDLLEALTLALARGVTVRALYDDLTIQPDAGPDVLHAAVVAFAKGRKAGSAFIGGKISGEAKEAVARAKAQRIADIYGMPTDKMSWSELIRVSGLVRNTIIKHLGKRPAAQLIYEANRKRAVARAKRKDQAHDAT